RTNVPQPRPNAVAQPRLFTPGRGLCGLLNAINSTRPKPLNKQFAPKQTFSTTSSTYVHCLSGDAFALTLRICDHPSMNVIARGWQGAVLTLLLSVATLVFSRSRIAEAVIFVLFFIQLAIMLQVLMPDLRNRNSN